MIDVALQYACRQVAVPQGKALWLYGVAAYASGDIYQPLQNQAPLLELKGHKVFSTIEAINSEYDAVFVCCPKQYEETQGLLAIALQKSRGFVMAVASNDAGGKRLGELMGAYSLPVEQVAKSRSTVAWTFKAPSANDALIAQNLPYLFPRKLSLEGNEWWSVPGIFSWDRIDAGSKLLIEHLPKNIAGNVADFGCGYGYISTMLASKYSGITQIDAYDVDARAANCCARNNSDKVHAIWQDITTLHAPQRYDYIVMNPPFHSGKAEDVNLGRAFIHKAMESLKSGGQLFMVANRHLAYEKEVKGFTILHENANYKIMTERAL